MANLQTEGLKRIPQNRRRFQNAGDFLYIEAKAAHTRAMDADIGRVKFLRMFLFITRKREKL